MQLCEEGSVSLRSLSNGQRRLVERHLPLIHLTLRRARSLVEHATASRERSELFQEGCLALMEAVRTHDPLRHGVFATFAMAMIHYAMSRFAHEQHNLIRVPYVTQRRRKQSLKIHEHDRHRPEPLPRVVPLTESRGFPHRRSARRRARYDPNRTGDETTIGDLVRERLDSAARSVATTMRESRRTAGGTRELVDLCMRERWTVPEPAEQTSIRTLARKLECSIGRITHSEERFRKRLGEMLDRDTQYQRLIATARRHLAGMQHVLSKTETEAMRSQETTTEHHGQV